MANIHEHAVLTDILQPQGSGFIGRHGDDFALANNAQWVGFGIEIGPDGSVYVLDWHDANICGSEVLNKDTGRIFRISAERSEADEFDNRYTDLSQLDDVALARLQSVDSSWHARRARSILQHRATTRELQSEAIDDLRSLYKDREIDRKLRGMWALHVTSQLSDKELLEALDDPEAYVRAWAIQLLCEDRDPSATALDRFVALSRTDPSPIVRLYLAAALQRLSDDDAKWAIIDGLASHDEDVTDHNLPHMIWFGLEPLVMNGEDRALSLAATSKIPQLSSHIARRLADAGQVGAVLVWTRC